MSSSFSTSSRTIVPRLVDGYKHSRDSRHSINTVPGAAAAIAVVFPASLRNGTLTAVFDSQADALAFDAMLADIKPITFADSDVSGLGMVFLMNGRSSLEQSAARGAWTVTFDFQEVTL